MKGGRIFLSQEDVAEVISGVGAHVSFYAYADGTGLGAMMCVPSDSPAATAPLKKQATGAVAPKPKAKAAAPAGRKRVSDQKMSGKVKNWRGGFGFVTPDSKVDHPLFTGSLFVHTSDVDAPDQMEIGKSVTFFLYADPQGLGAEECVVVSGAASGTPLRRSDSNLEDSSSTLLKAKPKASAGGPADPLLGTLMAPRAKGAPMMAKPKASAAGTADPELAGKMAANPELAKRLSAWMFDPGG